jgi:hypothetical protein
MASIAAIESAAPRASFADAVRRLGASILTGQIRETTLATMALYAWKQASNEALEAGVAGGIEVGARWFLALAAWLA